MGGGLVLCWTGDLGIGGRVWDGCLVLLEHLARCPELLKGRVW